MKKGISQRGRAGKGGGGTWQGNHLLMLAFLADGSWGLGGDGSRGSLLRSPREEKREQRAKEACHATGEQLVGLCGAPLGRTEGLVDGPDSGQLGGTPPFGRHTYPWGGSARQVAR